MEIGEIISDALHYPFGHVKALVIYMVLSFLVFLIASFTLGGATLAEAGGASIGIIGIIGLLLIIVIGLLMDGFALANTLLPLLYTSLFQSLLWLSYLLSTTPLVQL